MTSPYTSPPTSPPNSPVVNPTGYVRSPVWSPPSSVASSPPYSPVSCGSGELESIEVQAECDTLKSDMDKQRERGANIRALRLLDHEIAGEKYKQTSPVSPTSGQSARTAAARRYEEELKARKAAAAKLREDIKFNKAKSKLDASNRPERMAETTRKLLKGTEDVPDPETIAGMRCQVDRDRQKYAENMALELVSSEYCKDTAIV